MSELQKREDLSDKIKIALDKAIQRVIAETKAKNSYMVYSDKKGNIIKVPAKDINFTNWKFISNFSKMPDSAALAPTILMIHLLCNTFQRRIFLQLS